MSRRARSTSTAAASGTGSPFRCAIKMNLTTSQLTTISASQFNQIPQGKDYFPEGSISRTRQTGEISQYSGGANHMISAPVAAVMGLTATQMDLGHPRPVQRDFQRERLLP